MIELIKFEFKKIFDNKFIWVAALLVAVFVAVVPFFSTMHLNKTLGSREEAKALAEDYLSDSYTAKDIRNIEDGAVDKINKGEEISKGEHLLNVMSLCISKAEGNEEEEAIKSVDKELSDVDENSFLYKSLSKKKAMLEALPEKESVYIGEWFSVLDLNVAATMKMLILIVGIGGIFSKEYSSRTAYINLSTKHGKSKLNTAKIITAFIYAILVFVFVTALYFLSPSYLGLPNGDKPVSFIMNSVYNLSIKEYALRTLGFSFLGTLIFAGIILLLSLLTKNILITILGTIAIYIIPGLIDLGEAFNALNFSTLFTARSILREYTDFNIFGEPVLLPYVITVTAIISIIVLIVVSKIFSSKQTID